MTKRREEIREALEAPFTPDQITTNARGFRVVAHEVYKRRLIEATENNFNVEVSPPVILKEGQVIVTNRETGERVEAPVALAVVHIEIPGFGRRGDWGVQAIQWNQQEDAVKGAVSDGYKRACSHFGMGLDLYEGDTRPSGSGVSQGINGGQQQQATRSVGPGGAGASGFISEKQVKFLAVLLKRNEIVVDNVFKPYRLPENPELVAIPYRIGKGWIDALRDTQNDDAPGRVPTIPADLIDLVGKPLITDAQAPATDPSPQTNGVTPDLPEVWTEEKLGLGLPIQTQKDAWKKRVETVEATEANFIHLYKGAEMAMSSSTKAQGQQMWRLILLAMHAPTPKVLNLIIAYVDEHDLSSERLDQEVLDRWKAIGGEEGDLDDHV